MRVTLKSDHFELFTDAAIELARHYDMRLENLVAKSKITPAQRPVLLPKDWAAALSVNEAALHTRRGAENPLSKAVRSDFEELEERRRTVNPARRWRRRGRKGAGGSTARWGGGGGTAGTSTGARGSWGCVLCSFCAIRGASGRASPISARSPLEDEEWAKGQKGCVGCVQTSRHNASCGILPLQVSPRWIWGIWGELTELAI